MTLFLFCRHTFDKPTVSANLGEKYITLSVTPSHGMPPHVLPAESFYWEAAAVGRVGFALQL